MTWTPINDMDINDMDTYKRTTNMYIKLNSRHLLYRDVNLAN